MATVSFEIAGISWSTSNATGQRVYTLAVKKPFDGYRSDASKGRGCIGSDVESIYVGQIDCSAFKPGDLIRIDWGRMITGKNGAFQPIDGISLVEKGGIQK